MENYILSEDLAVWFGTKKKPKGSKQPKGPWVNICRKDKDGKHPPCGRSNTDKGGYPKCRATGVAGKMSDAEKKSACSQKRRAEKKDTQTGKGQKPVMTSHKKKTKNESIERLVNLITEKFKVLPNEYEKIYEDDTYLLVSPLTHNASCKYGANTKWCTTNRESDELFDEHFSSGILTYLIIKDKNLSNLLNGSKFAIYRGWKETPERTLVYDELNNEYKDGEKWLYNEFEKIDKEKDLYELIKIYNNYYDYMNNTSKTNVKTLKESIRDNLKLLSNKSKMSKELLYHVENKISLTENVFRYGSDKYFEVINEARDLMTEGFEFDEFDIELLETDMGKFGYYEDELVPLDFPIINEDNNQIDNYTSWSDGVDTITLQDILELTKDIEIINLPTKKLSKVVLNWDNNPEEIKRISQVVISKQYPVLIMVDENNNIQWILDGNHRTQKALRDDIPTIPVKLIKPSDLNSTAKKIFNINESEYQGKKVELGKPKKGGSKKYYVYVRNPKTGKVIKVSYGYPGMTANWNDPKARASFAARHRCEQKKDRTKAGYWACRAHKDFGNNVSGKFW